MGGKKKRGFFRRKKKEGALENGEVDQPQPPRNRAKSHGKKQKGFFKGLFRGKKRNKRAQTLGQNEEDIRDILSGKDGDDLIDQLYNSTKDGIEQNPETKRSGFVAHNPQRTSGMNNFNSFSNTANMPNNQKPKQIMPEKLSQPVVEPPAPPRSPPPIKPPIEEKHEKAAAIIEQKPKNKHFSQSIRTLLTGNESISKGSEEKEKETNLESSVISQNETENLDTEQILKSQYEVDTSADAKDKSDVNLDKKKETVDTIATELKEVEQGDKMSTGTQEVSKEEKPVAKVSKLQDFLNSLEDEEIESTSIKDDSESGVEEEEIKKPDVNNIIESPPVQQRRPKSPKRLKRRVVKAEDKPFKVSPSQREKREISTLSEEKEEKIKDIDKIVKGLTFKNEEQAPPPLDVNKLKQEIRTELKAEMEKEDRSVETTEKLRAECEEIQKTLKQERIIKDELSVELQKLKENFLQKENQREPRELQNREQEVMEKILAQNEKHLQSIHELVKETSSKGKSTVAEEQLKVMNEKSASLAAREEVELKRIENLTKQIKLEQSLLLEEEERKQAFELVERQRLNDLRTTGTFVEQYDLTALSQNDVFCQETSSSFRSWDAAAFLQEGLMLVDEKFHSPHFFETLQLLGLFCCFLVASGILTLSSNLFVDASESNAGLGWTPVFSRFDVSISNLFSLASFQVFHETYSQLAANVLALLRISSLFILTDRKPAILREVFLSSYISTIFVVICCSALPFASGSSWSGISGIVYAVTVHVICRGLFTTGTFQRIISILTLVACSRGMMGTVFNMSELPFLLSGCASGFITAYLANVQ